MIVAFTQIDFFYNINVQYLQKTKPAVAWSFSSDNMVSILLVSDVSCSLHLHYSQHWHVTVELSYENGDKDSIKTC